MRPKHNTQYRNTIIISTSMFYIQTCILYPDIHVSTISRQVLYPDMYFYPDICIMLYPDIYVILFRHMHLYPGICIIYPHIRHICITNQITDFLIYGRLFTCLFSLLLDFRWKYRCLIELCHKKCITALRLSAHDFEI